MIVGQRFLDLAERTLLAGRQAHHAILAWWRNRRLRAERHSSSVVPPQMRSGMASRA
jgi:hypothetical protein